MPEIVLGEGQVKTRATADPRQLAGHAARMFMAAGSVLLVGVFVDLFALWVLQRQEHPQWEFVALGTTANSFPLMMLGVVLLYGALAVKQQDSVAAYRVLAALAIAVGVFGLTVGFLIGTNFLALRGAGTVNPDSAAMLRGIVFKSGGVSLLVGVVMLLVGILGLRMPRQSS